MTKYLRTAGGNWNADASWSSTTGGAADTVAPTAADDILLDVNSGNLTINAAAACRSLNCTGYIGTVTHNTNITISIGDATAGLSNVALKFVAGMTYTRNSGSVISFVSTSATVQTITTGGKQLTSITVDGVGCSYQMADDLTMVTGTGFNFVHGTFDSNNFNVVTNSVGGNTSGLRVLNMGTSTWTLMGTSGDVWLVGSNITINSTNAKLVIGSVSSSSRNLWIGGTWDTITYNLAGSTGGLFISSSINIGTFNFSDATNGRDLAFANSSTVTITNAFNVRGISGGIITIHPNNPGQFTFTKSSGTVICDYISLTRSTAQGGAVWYAGSHSVDTGVGPNVGWIFTDPPSPRMSLLVVG